MRKYDNRNKLKLFVLVAVIILAIGYAIVTATLIVVKKNPINYFNIKDSADDKDNTNNNDNNNNNGDKSNRNNNNGGSEVPENKENGKFYVHYVTNNNSPAITGGTGTASVSDDKMSAFFYINSMSDNNTVYISYDVQNDSEKYDADLDIDLTNSNPEYFKVTSQIDNKILKENNKTKVTFKVELIKQPIASEETTTITGTIVAKPIKK